MTKEEIRNKVLELKTDEEIIEFIKDRIDELEKNTKPDTIGFGHKNIYDGFISNKINYIIGRDWMDTDYPSLVYDDIQPYFELIKKLAVDKNYSNEFLLFDPIFIKIGEYLFSNDNYIDMNMTILRREKIYLKALRNNEKKVSIKKVHEEKVGLCGETAGLAQNIFRILNVDSQLVTGRRDDEDHSFNLVFPYGYGNEPAVLYDPSHFINFINKDGKKYSTAYHKVLTSEEYKSILCGKATLISIEKTANNYIKFFPILEGCTFEDKKAYYSICNSTRKVNNEPKSR